MRRKRERATRGARLGEATRAVATRTGDSDRRLVESQLVRANQTGDSDRRLEQATQTGDSGSRLYQSRHPPRTAAGPVIMRQPGRPSLHDDGRLARRRQSKYRERRRHKRRHPAVALRLQEAPEASAGLPLALRTKLLTARGAAQGAVPAR